MAFGRFSFCGKGRGDGCEDARAYGRQTMFLHVHLLSFHGRLLASFRNTFLRSKQLFSKNLKKPLASRGRYFERSRKPFKKRQKRRKHHASSVDRRTWRSRRSRQRFRPRLHPRTRRRKARCEMRAAKLSTGPSRTCARGRARSRRRREYKYSRKLS